MYSQLRDVIREKLAKAAKFHRVDLHVHTCESAEDYPKQSDKRQEPPPPTEEDAEKDWKRYQAYFLTASQKATPPLSLVAITDHNRNKLASMVSKASSYPVVLPGVELNIQCTDFQEETIHLAAIWDKDAGHELLDRALHRDDKLPGYKERTNDSCSTTPMAEFIDGVHQFGGICIAAHANSTSGAREYMRGASLALAERRKRIKELEDKDTLKSEEEGHLTQLRREQKSLENTLQDRYLSIIAKYRIDAVEIASPEERKHYEGLHASELGIRPIPCVMSSDAHCLGDIGLPGHCTYLKMTEVGLNGMAHALADPQTRVRYDDQIAPTKYTRIQGIKFTGSQGFFRDQAVGFSDNLTCLIGARGTGKSALIDALRYVFALPLRHLEDKQRKDVEDRQLATLEDSEIHVLVRDRDDNELVLKARFSPDGESSTKCFGIDGSVRPEAPRVSPKLRIELWGWGEIESATRSLEQQRDLLDRFTPETSAAHEAIRLATRSVESNTRYIVETVRAIQDLLPKIALLDEKEAELAKLDTPEMKEIYREFDSVEQSAAALQTLSDALANTTAAFLSQQEEPYDIVADIASRIQDMRATLTVLGEIPSWFNEFEQAMVKRSEEASKHYEKLMGALTGMSKELESRVKKVQSERESVVEKLNRIQEGATEEALREAIGRRQELASEVNVMRQTRREVDELRERSSELVSERWSERIPDLQKARDELSTVRESKADQISQRLEDLRADLKVELTIQRGADRTLLQQALGSPLWPRQEGLLKGCGRHYKERDLAGVIAAHHTPTSFVQTVYYARPTDLTFQEDDKELISEEEAASIISHVLARDTNSSLPDPSQLQALLELEHLGTEDLPRICLNGRFIQGLSPGQRCSALMPIILLESDSPLIIDQPEDNLDNRLVFDLVVDILREMKETRQVIVATHNPNIPVSGDAEQIVVLESPAEDKGEASYQASIDDPDIIEQVKQIMEGGEEAFKTRAIKYGLRLA